MLSWCCHFWVEAFCADEGVEGMTTAANRLLEPGDPAPSFALPAVNRDGMVALEDYRGKGAVLVGLFRGLHCPFCRRQVVQLGLTRDKLAREGVETVAIVNTAPERARQYFQYRPTRVLLAADPEVRTHQAFGLPKAAFVPDDTPPSELQWPTRVTFAAFTSGRYDASGELKQPVHILEAMSQLNENDGFEVTETDKQISEKHGSQFTGHFLIDAQGTIRWSRVEGKGGPNDLINFPSDSDILAAVQAISH
jgi:peroxiredoxin